MERATFYARLEQARVLVADDVLRIARQKALIHHLNRNGPSGLDAEKYLHFLEGVQAFHVRNRDRLERELATAPVPAGADSLTRHGG